VFLYLYFCKTAFWKLKLQQVLIALEHLIKMAKIQLKHPSVICVIYLVL